MGHVGASNEDENDVGFVVAMVVVVVVCSVEYGQSRDTFLALCGSSASLRCGRPDLDDDDDMEEKEEEEDVMEDFLWRTTLMLICL